MAYELDSRLSGLGSSPVRGYFVVFLGKTLNSHSVPLSTQEYYPGPRGFLLFFLGKFCDMKCFCYFFHWHEVLRAEKGKPLVKTVGIVTFVPSAFDRRF